MASENTWRAIAERMVEGYSAIQLLRGAGKSVGPFHISVFIFYLKSILAMCGFVVGISKGSFPTLSGIKALDRLAARGPDGSGVWENDGIFLGHRRLAILDLDERALQPMRSICNRYVIVYNGEIYNYKAIRKEMEQEGIHFKTCSDTEVILALYAKYGEKMLERLHGMFAFVIWDTVTKGAFAARDPYGIKPLYVAVACDLIILASQVKAIRATGLISDMPDSVGQAGFWMLGSVPEPHTWYRDIKSVPAGGCLYIENAHIIEERKWCDISNIWRNAALQRCEKLSQYDVQENVRDALRESITRHLVSDVPVGVFLSGGIDSGALAGLISESIVGKLHGVTISYDEFSGLPEDESPLASEIAKHYGIVHHVRKVKFSEFQHDLPAIIDAMDQPTIDGINTWYASKAVAELGLKVVVSGVGGDELFLGYESFRYLPMLTSFWHGASQLPGAMMISKYIFDLQAQRTGINRWRYAAEWMCDIAGAWWLRRSSQAPDSLATVVLGADLIINNFSPMDWVKDMSGTLAEETTLALAQIESTTYLRNQLLRDSDWASMSHSVELRTPLVDSHLLEKVQPLLPCFSRYKAKQLLANSPVSALPKSVVSKRKTGFGIPVKQWLTRIDGGGDSWQSYVARHWM